MSIGSTGAEHARPELLVGGRYKLLRRLGSGGFGRVWLAHDMALAVDVAVKEVLLPSSLGPEELATRLTRAEREARNAARLRGHPNVVTVYDVVVEDGVPWTVMQMVHGRSLHEQLNTAGPLTPDQTVRVAEALLRALSAAHRAGILHRDVKPANVMLADDGAVLLTDFGIAVSAGDPALTTAGSVIGSAEYLAPERIRGRQAGPPSDLFSLGVTLYEAVEGRSPFRRPDQVASFGAVLLDAPPTPSRAAGALGEVIRGLMVKEPQQRMTAEAALARLAAHPASVPAPTQASPVGTAPSTVTALPHRPSPAGRSGSGLRSTSRARALTPLVLTAYFAVVAFLPLFTLPGHYAPSGEDTVLHAWERYRWYPDEPGSARAATAFQLLGLAVALLALALALLASRRGRALRLLAYGGLAVTTGLEVVIDVHYGGPWDYDAAIGPGYWCFWLGLAALVTSVIAVPVPGTGHPADTESRLTSPD